MNKRQSVYREKKLSTKKSESCTNRHKGTKINGIGEKCLTSKKSESCTNRQTDRRRRINEKGQTVYSREVFVK